jgi:hypothetical protein
MHISERVYAVLQGRTLIEAGSERAAAEDTVASTAKLSCTRRRRPSITVSVSPASNAVRRAVTPYARAASTGGAALGQHENAGEGSEAKHAQASSTPTVSSHSPD